MHVVIYRWRVKSDKEAVFLEGWAELTEAIYRTRGSLGSRLHRAADGTWVAVAQWPSEEVLRRSRELGPADEAAWKKMAEGSEEFLGEEHLEVVVDRLREAPFEDEARPREG
jgi:heme-degrading monooxygenase HmoA